MAKQQPTATAFTRSQESWADFVLPKIQAQIQEREDWLVEIGWNRDELPDDDILMDLYDDELFYIRFAKEMRKQRAILRAKYFGEEG